MFSCVAPPVRSYLSHLIVVLFCPFYLLEQITQVPFDRNVVNTRCQIAVKVLVIFRVLFKDYGISSKQVRKTIRGYCAVNVQLIFVL